MHVSNAESKGNLRTRVFGLIALSLGGFLIGCERQEKVLDIETPGVDIEVERSSDGTAVDIEADEHVNQ